MYGDEFLLLFGLCCAIVLGGGYLISEIHHLWLKKHSKARRAGGLVSRPRRRRKNSGVAAIGVPGSTATTTAEVSEIEVKRVQNLTRDAIEFLREAGATDEEIVAAFLAETIEILSSYPEKERKAALRRIDEGSRRGG